MYFLTFVHDNQENTIISIGKKKQDEKKNNDTRCDFGTIH